MTMSDYQRNRKKEKKKASTKNIDFSSQLPMKTPTILTKTNNALQLLTRTPISDEVHDNKGNRLFSNNTAGISNNQTSVMTNGLQPHVSENSSSKHVPLYPLLRTSLVKQSSNNQSISSSSTTNNPNLNTLNNFTNSNIRNSSNIPVSGFNNANKRDIINETIASTKSVEPNNKVERDQHKDGYKNQGLVKIAMEMGLLGTPMLKPHKIISEDFIWSENIPDKLLEQTNYLVIGCLGLQGVGKSFIMSLLAGSNKNKNKNKNDNSLNVKNNNMSKILRKEILKNNNNNNEDGDDENDDNIKKKNWIFKLENDKDMESGVYQTAGVHLHSNQERGLFLDTQPVLSISNLVKKEKKYSQEIFDYGTEVQSIQLASFLMSVCNVVCVVLDWFVDNQIINLLKTADMMRPSFKLEDNSFQAPYIYFIQNKYNDEEEEDENNDDDDDDVNDSWKDRYLKEMLKGTNLKITGLLKDSNKVNFSTIPFYNNKKKNNNNENNTENINILNYGENVSLEERIKIIKKNIYHNSNRTSCFNKLTEKKWLQFANKTWENIKKSPLISEYNRFLS